MSCVHVFAAYECLRYSAAIADDDCYALEAADVEALEARRKEAEVGGGGLLYPLGSGICKVQAIWEECRRG